MAKKPVKKATVKKAAPKKAAVVAKPEPVIKVRRASAPKNQNSGAYTQSEFLENVRAFCGLRKRTEAKILVEDLALFIKDSLKRGYKVPFLGLGKLYVRKTKPRMGRNPATGEPIQIPARKRVRFTPNKAFKDAVLH